MARGQRIQPCSVNPVQRIGVCAAAREIRESVDGNQGIGQESSRVAAEIATPASVCKPVWAYHVQR